MARQDGLVLSPFLAGRPYFLSEEKRKHNQRHEEESRQRANPSEITFDVSVIGIEFSARG
jgi:hypothetical protein